MNEAPFCSVQGPNQGGEIIRIEVDRKTITADWPAIRHIAESVQDRPLGATTNMGEAIATLAHLIRRQAITECAIVATRADAAGDNAADAIFALLGTGSDRVVTEEELLAALKQEMG